MDNPIDRDCAVANVSFASGGTESGAIDIRRFAFGSLQLPSEFNGDTITFKGCDTVDGTFQLIRKRDETASYTFAAVTDIWKELDGCVFGVAFLKVVTNTATAGAATGKISLKT